MWAVTYIIIFKPSYYTIILSLFNYYTNLDVVSVLVSVLVLVLVPVFYLTIENIKGWLGRRRGRGSVPQDSSGHAPAPDGSVPAE